MEHVKIIHNKPYEAIAIMREVASWGREIGLRVWPEEWLTAEELFSEEATSDTFCIGEVDGKAACAFILQNSDTEYWENHSFEPAVYLHKFFVRREFAHKEMKKWSERFT